MAELRRGLLQQPEFRQQSITAFHPLGVDWNARHRAHLNALGFVKMAHTLGAFVGVDFVNLWP